MLKAGYEVTVWNRSAAKCKELEAEGATVAASPDQAAAAADITVAMLADPPAALAVAQEAVKGISSGACGHNAATNPAWLGNKVPMQSQGGEAITSDCHV